jgi:hypothetical protein
LFDKVPILFEVLLILLKLLMNLFEPLTMLLSVRWLCLNWLRFDFFCWWFYFSWWWLR